ncbi:hypothetical protein CANTEDRAFT_114674, partial [Yamadazyma tenuis ATCC 10573]
MDDDFTSYSDLVRSPTQSSPQGSSRRTSGIHRGISSQGSTGSPGALRSPSKQEIIEKQKNKVRLMKQR